MEKLEKVSWSLAEQILEKLRTDWPTHILMYSTLKTHYTVRSLGPDHNFNLLTPGGKVDEFATFFVTNEEQLVNLFFYSCHPDPERVVELLKNCEYINWSKFVVVGPIAEKYEPTLEKFCKDFNAEIMLKNERFSIYWSSSESGKKLKYECPPDVYIAPIKEHHAELINSLWPHRDEFSISSVRKIIKYLGGFGVFLKETDELVSWTLRSLFGGLGFLQTIETHKRKGYGILVATVMTKDFNERGECSVLLVLDSNTPSQKLFSKLNYKKESGVYWFKLKKF